MNVLRSLLIVAGVLFGGALCHAQMIPDNVGKSSNGLPPALVNVGFDPQLNAQIPLDTPFLDEYGKPATLRQFTGKKPLVLAFVYFNCPMLCSQVEQAVVGALKMTSFNPGSDYDVVFISFDPSDTPEAALQKKQEALSRFARPGTEAGWHFLTGTQPSIDAVTKAAAFRFTYDPKTRLYGHASGILLLTPDGRISRYFFGVEYPPSNVRLGLVDASSGKIGTPVDHLLLFCYQYDPTTAHYSATILTVIRMGGVVTLFCLALGFVIFRRRDHRSANRGNIGPGSPTQGAH
ncbi:MAG TPA: SCO family protein [Candidatus Eremiobacteraceae bacterium]|nr:SCO family protein [Candidatus Eremiobacteraceae bacterium]